MSEISGMQISEKAFTGKISDMYVRDLSESQIIEIL